MVTLWDFNYSKRLLRVKEFSQDTIQLEWNYLDVFLKENGSQTHSSIAHSVVLTLSVLMSKRACSHAQFHFVLVVNAHTATSNVNFNSPN